MPFYEPEEKAPLLPLMTLAGRAGLAGYLLLGIEVMRVASLRGRDPSEYAEVDGSALLQIAYVGVCLVYGCYRWTRSSQRGAFYLLRATPALPLVIYTVLCTLSSLWSSNPSVTFYRSMECLAYIILMALVCDNLNLRCSRQDFVEWIVLWSMWFLGWDLIRVVRLMGPGVFESPYAFRAGNFGLSAVFFLTLFLSRRRLFVLINLVFMTLSGANTAYFGILLGLIPGLLAGGRRYQKALFFVVGLAVLAWLWIGPEVVQYTLFYGKSGVGLSQTSGRDQVWQYALDYGRNQLLHGYGFVAGETDALRAAGAAAITSHNVFLSALLSIGVAGPVLFLVFFAWLAYVALRPDVCREWRPALLGTVLMVFTTSIASPGLGARVYGAWIPSVLVCLAISTLTISDALKELNIVTMGWDGDAVLESVR